MRQYVYFVYYCIHIFLIYVIRNWGMKFMNLFHSINCMYFYDCVNLCDTSIYINVVLLTLIGQFTNVLCIKYFSSI